MGEKDTRNKHKKSGPKSMIYKWEQPDNLFLIQGWKRNGLTDEQIAKNIGIGTRTLYDWRDKSPQITQALKRGKIHADFMVENALYKKALEGNVTAQIFWLKNRKPEDWKDRRETEVTGNLNLANTALEIDEYLNSDKL